MKRTRRALGRLAAALTVVSAGLLAGCSLTSSSGLIVYSGQHPQTTAALVAAFERDTGITVLVRNGDESALADQLIAEGPNTPADIVLTENSPALWALQERHLLAPVEASTLSQVPAQFSSPSGDWVGVTARVSVLVYNTQRLSSSQLPSSVLDLSSPRWQGLLGIAPGETDFQPIVTAVLRAKGQAATLAWLHGLKDNAGPRSYPDNETLVSDVNTGASAIGLINQYYWYRLRAQVGAAGMHSALASFAPGDPGYVVDVSGAGILASSKHQGAAQRFLQFLVSATGQEVIAHGDSFEYPLRPGVQAGAGETPFDQLQPDALTVADLGDGAEAVALLQQAQLL